jgi:hypothetical protein
MRIRARLGAAATVGLGALLLATLLASPALAWHSNVTVNARCLDGQVRVHYTVRAWETGHEAKVVEVSYELDGLKKTLDSGFFAPHHNQFSGHFDLAAGTTGTIKFTVTAHWEGAPASTDYGSDTLPPAEKCAETAPTTTVAPTPTTAVVAPATSLTTPTTEDDAVLGATNTTSGAGQLPFTGASSGPMLLAGIGLVGGGFLFLFASRARGRHAVR